MIEADSLVYEYSRTRALDGATLTAPSGEITALVGPNGAGKTTLMRILAGLQRPQGGRATIDGVDVSENPRAVHRMVAFTADFIGLYDALTAERHLIYAGRCAGLDRSAAKARADETAARLEILDLMPRRAEEMSRGQRQRLAIAQALMKAPRLLILDEPASGLDPEARRTLSELLLALKAEGATMLVSSHILSELDDYSDRVVVMKEGRVVRIETLGDADPAPSTQGGTEIVTAVLAEATPNLAAKLADAAKAASVEFDVIAAGEETAKLRVPSDPAGKAAVLSALVAVGVPVVEFSVRKRRLADAYFDHGDGAGTGGGERR